MEFLWDFLTILRKISGAISARTQGNFRKDHGGISETKSLTNSNEP